MLARVVIMAVSLGAVGYAGYASWAGLGSLSRDTGAAAVARATSGASRAGPSLRSGSVGNSSFRSLRVK